MSPRTRSLPLILVALACLASATTAGATESSGTQVVANVYPSGAQYTTTIGALESSCPENTVNTAPQQYGPGGSQIPAPQSPTSDQWTVPELLGSCLSTPIQVSSVSEVIVYSSTTNPSPNGSGVLSQQDLTGADFANNALPIFWDAGSNVGYERPSRGTSDDNFADQIEVDPGGTLNFDVYTNGAVPAKLVVTASPSTAGVGKPVTFAVQGGQPGDSYSWIFGDGVGAAAASPTHSFPVAGVYDVTVREAGQVDGYGSLQIQIGSPTPQAGTTTVKTGPARSSGKTPGGKPGKHRRGPSGVTSKRPHKPKAKTHPKAAPKKVTKTTTDAVVTPPPAPPSSGSGSHGGTHTGTAVQKTPNSSSGADRVKVVVTHHRAPTQVPTRRTTPHLPQVHGRMLGTIKLLPGGAEKLLLATTAAGSALPLTRPPGPGPWALIAALAVVVGLLSLGAGRELRHVRSAR